MDAIHAPATLTIVRRLSAPPAAVFRAWTDPATLHWFFNPGMTPSGPATVDLRVGGEWRQHMVVDASTAYMTGGIYREIVPDRKLVFAWGAVDGWPRIDPGRLDEAPQATVLLEPDGEGTRMVFRLDLPPSRRDDMPMAMIEAGWGMTLQRLADRYPEQAPGGGGAR